MGHQLVKVLVAAAAIVAVVGCGSGDSSSTSAQGESVTPKAAPIKGRTSAAPAGMSTQSVGVTAAGAKADQMTGSGLKGH